MLERTAGQTLWWVLGHPVSIAVVAAVLAAAVIVASADRRRVGAAIVDGTATPSSATETAADTGPTEATMILICPAAAQLTVTAPGPARWN